MSTCVPLNSPTVFPDARNNVPLATVATEFTPEIEAIGTEANTPERLAGGTMEFTPEREAGGTTTLVPEIDAIGTVALTPLAA
jgi:hypothetical protein